MSVQIVPWRALRVVAALSVTLVPSVVAADELPQPLTLAQAIEAAFDQSPALRAQRARVEAIRGRLASASAFPYDPEVTVEAARRSSGGESDLDREVRIAQVFEIGGQRRHRVTQVNAELDAALAAVRRAETVLAARVAAAFVDALLARERVIVENANTALVGSLTEVARKRLDAGAVAQMEVNLAQAQLGRAVRRQRVANGEYAVARALLAEAIGVDPAHPPQPVGKLHVPEIDDAEHEAFVMAALERRADLQALDSSRLAARARVAGARRQGWPDLATEVFYGREDGSDRLAGAAIGIRIPLFRRNRGVVSEALAHERAAIATAAAAELSVRAEIAATRARHESYVHAARDLAQQVIATLDENLRLLRRSYESGKTSWTEVLVFRREFVDIQRDYIETLANAMLAAIALDLAAGNPPSIAEREELR